MNRVRASTWTIHPVLEQRTVLLSQHTLISANCDRLAQATGSHRESSSSISRAFTDPLTLMNLIALPRRSRLNVSVNLCADVPWTNTQAQHSDQSHSDEEIHLQFWGARQNGATNDSFY